MTHAESPSITHVAVLSDVSVGYGTPQVLSLAGSLAQLWSANTVIYEPDQPERPPVRHTLPGVDVQRIYTATHPYTPSGRTEFCLTVIDRVNQTRPQVIVLSSFLAAPVIAKLSYRPKAVIYYGLEHTDGGRPNEQRLFRTIADKIDLAIFPEEQRAVLDRPRLGLEATPTAVVYNGSNTMVPWLSAEDRNGRLFYGGLIHPHYTYGDWFMGGALDDQPLDMFGIIDGYHDRTALVEGLQRRQSRVTYRGYVPSGAGFLKILQRYCFSLVIWSPHTEATHFAAPNKFFDAIASGVPPIVAPHPLCVKLVERYGCGLIVEEFSLKALKRTLTLAEDIILRHKLSPLIEGCRAAHADLNWSAQFAKLAPHLTRMLMKGQEELFV